MTRSPASGALCAFLTLLLVSCAKPSTVRVETVTVKVPVTVALSAELLAPIDDEPVIPVGVLSNEVLADVALSCAAYKTRVHNRMAAIRREQPKQP